MNRRQRKKKNKQQEITALAITKEDYRKMRENIEYHKKQALQCCCLPICILEQQYSSAGSRRIEIKQESEVKQNEL